VDGTPERTIGQRFGLSAASAHRHRDHVAALLVPAPGASPRDAQSLRERVTRLVGRLESLADEAHEQRNALALIASSRELIRAFELLGKATGELRDKTSLPEAIREAIGAPPEEARAAVESRRRAEAMDEAEVVKLAAETLREYCARHGLTGLTLPPELDRTA
jgi:hypothetical protein